MVGVFSLEVHKIAEHLSFEKQKKREIDIGLWA
jgi:hypothetical protein